MKSLPLISLVFIFLLCACQSENPEHMEAAETTPETIVVEEPLQPDPHSFARPSEARVTHLDLDLTVNFEEKILTGTATYDIEVSPNARMLTLDIRDLTIKGVRTDGEPTSFEIGEPQEYLGNPLRISITSQTKKVSIDYQTSPDAAGLQWLSPEQTDSKKYPFLFSQSQAILARTWIPTQDSPGIRITYQATLRVPKELLPLMSATNPQQKNETGEYTFKMEQPIPSYLLAIAVGDLKFQALSERAGVYASPSVLEEAAYEFGDLEKMIIAAEKLYGKYRWDRYDLLVLPASFPFGGMENPRLTFATPTILAGDRSLVSLVAHELAHSWSGNLVTNATWDDFWLNEGFTVYFETRIMEAVYGKDYAEMLALVSRKQLEQEIEAMMKENPEDTRLKLNLEGRDPDEGLTAIAYDKGYFFLRMLEEQFGRTMFDQFVKEYFQEHAFKSVNTEQFVEYLNDKLISRIKGGAQKAMINQWIYEDGLPVNMPEVSSPYYEEAITAAQQWTKGKIKAQNIKTEGWKYQQYEFFLRSLPDSLSQHQMEALDDRFGFAKSGNSEILGQWFLHVARNQYKTDYPVLRDFLLRVGRRKFIAPIYAELAKNPESLQWAREVYNEARPNYHYVAFSTIDEILGVAM